MREATVIRSELRDSRMTGARLREDGTLSIYATGKGLSIRMGADDLRSFGRQAFAIADLVEAHDQAIADAAMQQLAALHGGES